MLFYQPRPTWSYSPYSPGDTSLYDLYTRYFMAWRVREPERQSARASDASLPPPFPMCPPPLPCRTDVGCALFIVAWLLHCTVEILQFLEFSRRQSPPYQVCGVFYGFMSPLLFNVTWLRVCGIARFSDQEYTDAS